VFVKAIRSKATAAPYMPSPDLKTSSQAYSGARSDALRHASVDGITEFCANRYLARPSTLVSTAHHGNMYEQPGVQRRKEGHSNGIMLCSANRVRARQ